MRNLRSRVNKLSRITQGSGGVKTELGGRAPVPMPSTVGPYHLIAITLEVSPWCIRLGLAPTVILQGIISREPKLNHFL